MVSVLPQQDPLGSALGGLIPGLFQQPGQQNQNQALLSLLGGGGVGALGGLLGQGGQGGDQMEQLLKIAQEAGLENTDDFKNLLTESGLFGKGEAAPQSLLQLLLGTPLGAAGQGIRGAAGALGGGLADLLVNVLPGGV